MLHYLQNSRVYNSQNPERTQKSTNRGMDTETIANISIHNGATFRYLKEVTELTNEFSPEGYRMGERQPKKWSTILVIMEMQIKQTGNFTSHTSE